MKNLLIGAIAGALLCTPAFAQQQRGANVGAGNNNFGAGGGAVFQLPPSVKNVVSIDAYNMLIIESESERTGETQYTPTIIRHVYSGGIARLFGGSVVPTAQLVTPGLLRGGMGAQGNNGGFGGNNGGGAFQGGGFNGGGNFQNGGGFQGGGFNNGGGFQGGGFNGGAAFGNTVLQGNGFNTQNGGVVTNLSIQAR